jgi:hypothetical protein
MGLASSHPGWSCHVPSRESFPCFDPLFSLSVSIIVICLDNGVDFSFQNRHALQLCLGNCILRFVNLIAFVTYFSLSCSSVVPIDHCRVVLYVLTSFLIVGAPSTLALFFLRVKAIYAKNKAIAAFFCFFWLAIFGTLFITPFDVTTTHIPGTKRCMIIKVGYYSAIPVLLHSAFDTLVFIAISFRIASYSRAFSSRTSSLLRGNRLPLISRRILQGGQLYYLFVSV